ALTFLTVVFMGCSKDEDNDPSKGVVKFTVTSSGTFNTANNHSLDVSIGAFDADGNFLDVKINGEVSSGVKVLHRKHDADFNGGKTYTFETVGNYSQVQINVAAFSVSGSFDLNYKIEQGGKVIADESLTISEDGNAYTQPYVLK